MIIYTYRHIIKYDELQEIYHLIENDIHYLKFIFKYTKDTTRFRYNNKMDVLQEINDIKDAVVAGLPVYELKYKYKENYSKIGNVIVENNTENI